MKKTPIVKQHDEKDCGAAVAATICKYWGVHYPLAKVRDIVKTDMNGTTVWGLVEGLKRLGFVAEGLSGNRKELVNSIASGEIKYPFIAHMLVDNLEHFVVVYSVNKRTVRVGDPAQGIVRTKSENFFSMWTGHVITATPGEDFVPLTQEKNSILKFLHIVFAQKKMLVLSLALSLAISLITIFGSTVFYTVVEQVSGAIETEDEHQAQYDEEETPHEHTVESGTGNYIETWSDNLLLWLESQEFVLMVDEVFSNVNAVFVLILGMYFLRVFFNIARGKALAVLSRNVETSILKKTYTKLLNLPLDFFESHTTGEIMSRFDDVTEISNAISGGALTIILDSLMVLLTGVILFFLSKKLALISAATISLYLVIMLIFKASIGHISQTVMQKNAGILSMIKQSVDGILDIKAFGNRSSWVSSTDEVYDLYTCAKVKAAMLETTQASIATFVSVSGLVAMLFLGMKMCLAQTLTLSILITYYNIYNYFLSSVVNLVSLQSDIQTAVVSMERLNDILDCTDDVVQGQAFENGAITLDHVAFRYGGSARLFDDLNLYIEKGKKIAIIGESGCGKTTLAKLISGYYAPEQGHVLIGGHAVGTYASDELRNHVFYVSGAGQLFQDSVKNNITMGHNGIHEEDVIDICKALGLDDFIRSLPYGYDTLIDDNGSIFSTGQRQRIQLARALVQNPDILVMDEATANLDPLSERLINDALNKLRGTTTCVIIAHRVNSIKDCDCIFVMDRGRIVDSGTHEMLAQSNNIYKCYLFA